MTRSKNEKISQYQKLDRTVVLKTLFELRVDVVIGMTHPRKVLKMKFQTQYFMKPLFMDRFGGSWIPAS